MTIAAMTATDGTAPWPPGRRPAVSLPAGSWSGPVRRSAWRGCSFPWPARRLRQRPAGAGPGDLGRRMRRRRYGSGAGIVGLDAERVAQGVSDSPQRHSGRLRLGQGLSTIRRRPRQEVLPGEKSAAAGTPTCGRRSPPRARRAGTGVPRSATRRPSRPARTDPSCRRPARAPTCSAHAVQRPQTFPALVIPDVDVTALLSPKSDR